MKRAVLLMSLALFVVASLAIALLAQGRGALPAAASSNPRVYTFVLDGNQPMPK